MRFSHWPSSHIEGFWTNVTLKPQTEANQFAASESKEKIQAQTNYQESTKMKPHISLNSNLSVRNLDMSCCLDQNMTIWEP